MSRRFEGAITTPAGERDSSVPPPPSRPSRPILLEIAAALLVVGGLTALVGSFGSALSPPPGASTPMLLLGLFVALDVLTVFVGLLVRAGRAWVLAINVVAVVLFVELTAVAGGSAVAVLFAALDAVVLFALFRHRPWFDWAPPAEEDA